MISRNKDRQINSIGRGTYSTKYMESFTYVHIQIARNLPEKKRKEDIEKLKLPSNNQS